MVNKRVQLSIKKSFCHKFHNLIITKLNIINSLVKLLQKSNNNSTVYIYNTYCLLKNLPCSPCSRSLPVLFVLNYAAQWSHWTHSARHVCKTHAALICAHTLFMGSLRTFEARASGISPYNLDMLSLAGSGNMVEIPSGFSFSPPYLLIIMESYSNVY